MHQLTVLTKDGEWWFSKFDIGDSCIWEGNEYTVQGFSVLQTTPPINYDIGVGRCIPEDELNFPDRE